MFKTLATLLIAASAAGTAQADAMGDFADIFAACRTTFQNIRAGGVVAEGAGVFTRKINTESRLKYEISQKYYSSPFVATTTINLAESFGSAATQAEAQQLVAGPENRLKHDVVTIVYTTQNGVWTTTDVTVTSESKRRRDDVTWAPPLTVKLGRDVAMRSSEPWAACIR